MPDLEMIQAETNVAVVANQPKTEQYNTVFEVARRLHSANWIEARVAAALETELSNGSMPA